jgi:tetratricopeptide (TPR) repeat protein
MCYKDIMNVYASWALIAVLLAGTIARNAVWADDGWLWNDIIEKSPRKARAYNEYGLHVLETGDYDLALRLLGRSLELDRYQPQVYVNLGLAYERKNDIERAIAAYERAIFVHPDDPTAYYNLGVLHYRRLKDRDKALGYFLKARELNPMEPDVHQFLASIYRDQGNVSQSAREMALYESLRHH